MSSLRRRIAICVLIIAVAASDPADEALILQLKPNQPNQSVPAPRSTSGMLWGRIGSRLNPSRFPENKG